MSLDITQYRIGKCLFQSGIFLFILFINLLLGDTGTEFLLTLLNEGTSGLLGGINQIGGLLIVAIEL